VRGGGQLTCRGNGTASVRGTKQQWAAPTRRLGKCVTSVTPDASLSRSKDPTTGFRPYLAQSIPRHHILRSTLTFPSHVLLCHSRGPFPSEFLIRIFHESVASPLRPASLAHHSNKIRPLFLSRVPNTGVFDSDSKIVHCTRRHVYCSHDWSMRQTFIPRYTGEMHGHRNPGTTICALGHSTYEVILTVHTHKLLVCLSAIKESWEHKKSRLDKQ
jgi:hypothetical protein